MSDSLIDTWSKKRQDHLRGLIESYPNNTELVAGCRAAIDEHLQLEEYLEENGGE